jgi:hypothetical protein
VICWRGGGRVGMKDLFIKKEIRKYRHKRLKDIVENNYSDKPYIVINLIPYSFLDFDPKIDFNVSDENLKKLKYLYSNDDDFKIEKNFYGYLSQPKVLKKPIPVTQLKMDGVIESISELKTDKLKHNKVISFVKFKGELLKLIKSWLNVINFLNIEKPYVFSYSVVNAEDYYFSYLDETKFTLNCENLTPLKIKSLNSPEVMITDLNCDFEIKLRPIIDALWYASGWKEPFRSEQ